MAHSRAQKRAAKATVAAAEAARAAEEKRVRDAFSADSAATATRLAHFFTKYAAAPIENSPLLQVPVPVGMPVRSFLEQVWSDYARVIDPQVTAERENELLHQYYVDIMNDGPLRPTAILLPPMKQDKTKIVVERPSFPAITRGQVAVGWREPPPEPLADSLAAATAAAAGQQAAPETGGESTPPPASTPSEPVPAEPAPAEPAPPEPVPVLQPPAEPVPPAQPATPDSVPKG